MGRDTAQLSTPSPERDVPVKPEQELVDQFQLSYAGGGGGSKDIMIAANVERYNKGVWVFEGSQWVKQCDVPKELPSAEVFFCAVADGFIRMGGIIDLGQNSSVCYHYSLSERKWKRLSDMITPKNDAEAVEISPMVVMVLAGYIKNFFSAKCEILKVVEGEWSSVKPLPEYIRRVRAAAAGGRVFIVGEYGDNEAPAYELLEYNPSTDTYTKIQIDLPRSPINEFYFADMTAVAGKLYLVGGVNIEYDIATQHITQLAKPKATPYYSCGCCAVVRGNNILLCGGRDEEHAYNAMEEYSRTTHQWRMLDVSLPFAYSKSSSFVANISV